MSDPDVVALLEHADKLGACLQVVPTSLGTPSPCLCRTHYDFLPCRVAPGVDPSVPCTHDLPNPYSALSCTPW